MPNMLGKLGHMVQTIDKPQVSVVTATFNALDGLKTTVRSVAEQTSGSVEHIIIDGGSSDGTQAYLESLGDRVRWISEPDDGIADAMNKGIAMARGEYVLVLQAEDTFANEGSLGLAAKELVQGEDIVAFPVLIAENDRSMRLLAPRGSGFLARFQMTLPHQGVFCRRNLFARIGLFNADYRIAMDYEFFLRAQKTGATASVHAEPVSIMPATGISSQRDWASVARRMAEFRKAQRAHYNSVVDKLLRGAYWSAYIPYKRLKVGLARS